MEDNLYNGKNIILKSYNNEIKNEFISFMLNFDKKELSELNISEINSIDTNLNPNNIIDIINNKEINFYILHFNNEIIGLYCLKKKNNNEINFIIKKDRRNKGFGKIGLHYLIKELSSSEKDISEYSFTVNKKNIPAILIICGNNGIISKETETEYILKISKDNNVWIHKVFKCDMDKILKITDSAKKLLKSNGSLQWQQGYPNEETFLNDIKNGNLYGLYEDNDLKAYGCYLYGLDVNYVEIDGKWDIPANEKDMAIHRVAVDENCHGKKYGVKMLSYGIQYAKKLGCVTVKVDTHKNNIPMQKCIQKCGFVYKGIIKILRDKLDNLRLAYEIVL